MVLIYQQNSWGEYIKSLSHSAKKNWRFVSKANSDLTYKEVPFSEKVGEYMNLWGRQLVRGNPIEWAYPVGHVENLWIRGELKVFESELAMHFIQKRDGYWEAHPPMYDKKYNERGLATWMWFMLIKYATENRLGIINMGGGIDDWREMIRRRDEFPNPKYKWRFVPENVKNNPETQPNYKIEEWKLLTS
jgi:hypothetical protein